MDAAAKKRYVDISPDDGNFSRNWGNFMILLSGRCCWMEKTWHIPEWWRILWTWKFSWFSLVDVAPKWKIEKDWGFPWWWRFFQFEKIPWFCFSGCWCRMKKDWHFPRWCKFLWKNSDDSAYWMLLSNGEKLKLFRMMMIFLDFGKVLVILLSGCCCQFMKSCSFHC